MTTATVKFRITRSGHVVVSAVIAGCKVRLVVDTAAGTSVLDVAAVNELGLKTRRNSERRDVKGIGTSQHVMQRLIVPSIVLGRREFVRPRFISLDLTHVKEVGGKRGMHGLLGGDFLKKHDAVIDYASRIITLRTTTPDMPL